MVEIHRNTKEETSIQYLYVDNHERVIVFPTFYIQSLLRRPRFSLKSVYQFANVLRYFCEEIQSKFPQMSVDDALKVIEGNFIDQYLKKLAMKGYEYSTIRNRDAIIKRFMEWLTTEEAGKPRMESGYYNNKFKSPTPSKKMPKFVIAEDVIKFSTYLHDENQRCLMHFLFDTGLRISEVVQMKKRDLPDLNQYPVEQNYFKLTVPGVKGRGGQVKWRTTLITRAMVERINRLHKNNKNYLKASIQMKENMPLFLNVHGKPITSKAISDLLYKASKRSGMQMHAHLYRHGYAMSILASELDTSLTNLLVIVRETLGHNDIRTSQIYANVAPVVVQKIKDDHKKFNVNYRFEEAQRIFDKTFKPQKFHKEKRGRK
jgi:integrase/recombinase XerD